MPEWPRRSRPCRIRKAVLPTLQQPCFSKAWNSVSWHPPELMKRKARKARGLYRNRANGQEFLAGAGCEVFNVMDKARRFPRLIGSGESREKHYGVALVFGEAGTKFLTEKRFLAAGFGVKAEPSAGQEEKAAHIV